MAYVELGPLNSGQIIQESWTNQVNDNFIDHETRISAIGASTTKYLTNADSPFTITDGDGFGKFICDTSGGDITIILPTLVDNQDRELEFIHQTGGNNLIIDGEVAETIDGLATVELPKQYDRMKIIGTVSEWAILEERISCEIITDTYVGFGTTDNKIMRFTNASQNIGNMFSENHSTGYNGNTEGLEIIINRSGKYSFCFIGNSGASGGDTIGISLNSTQLTTAVGSINARDRKAHEQSPSGGSFKISCSWSGVLDKNDIIRAHTDGVAPGVFANMEFTATYIGN